MAGLFAANLGQFKGATQQQPSQSWSADWVRRMGELAPSPSSSGSTAGLTDLLAEYGKSYQEPASGSMPYDTGEMPDAGNGLLDRQKKQQDDANMAKMGQSIMNILSMVGAM